MVVVPMLKIIDETLELCAERLRNCNIYLRVRWDHDRRLSRFPLSWLRDHAYAIERARVVPPAIAQ